MQPLPPLTPTVRICVGGEGRELRVSVELKQSHEHDSQRRDLATFMFCTTAAQQSAARCDSRHGLLLIATPWSSTLSPHPRRCCCAACGCSAANGRGAGGWDWWVGITHALLRSSRAVARVFFVSLFLSTSEHGSRNLRRSCLGDLSGTLVLRVVVKSVRLGKNRTAHNERLSTYRGTGATALHLL